MSFTGKSPSDTYKDILNIDNSNSGVDSTARTVKTADGSSSAMALSDRALIVKSNTNNVNALQVKNASDTAKFNVDTTNNQVKALGTHVNTQYQYFGGSLIHSTGASAGYHTLLQEGHGWLDATATIAPVNMGNGTDPATSLTFSDNAMNYIKFFWYVPANISIDAVTSLEAADAAAGDTTRFHLFEYDYTDGSASVLTNGTLVAHSADQVNAGREQLYFNTWTIDSANISSGKVILATHESDTINSDYITKVTVKYHLT